MKNLSSILFILFFVDSSEVLGFSWSTLAPSSFSNENVASPERSIFENELEFIAYRAPVPLDWTSPGSLTRSTLFNTWYRVGDQYYPHAISHINIKIKCQNEKPIYRGMAGTKPTGQYLKEFLIEGASLDVLLRPTEGRFFKDKEILSWLTTLKKLDFARSIHFKLNPHQCEAMKSYLEEYEALGLNKIYGGLGAHPYRGEGAGCAAFAISFLDLLQNTKELSSQWKRKLRIPQNLLRKTDRPAYAGFLDFVFGYNSRWAEKSETHLEVSFWDPQLIYNWIGTHHRYDSKSKVTYVDLSNLELHPRNRVFDKSVQDKIRQTENWIRTPSDPSFNENSFIRSPRHVGGPS